MAPLIVDDEDKIRSLLAHITKRVSEQCLIFADIEGVDLSRSGAVAIMQILMPPEPTVYLVDVHVLGSKALDLTTPSGTSLRSVLESSSVFKVFFDIRNDSDALHAHFGVQVAGIIDLQILEYATRRPRGRFVNGLAKCIEKDLPYSPGWSTTKANGQRLFRPDQGGRYEVFLDRPIRDDIAKYCEQDVMLMPQLLARYGPRIQPDIAAQIQAIVDERIRLSKSATYNGKGRHMAIGPHIGYTATNANTSFSPEVNIVRSPHLHKLCRLDNLSVPSLVADFNAIDLKHETSNQVDDKKTETERDISTSMPVEKVTTTSSEPRLPPVTATRMSGPSISAINSIFSDQHEGQDSDDEHSFENNGYSSFGRNKSYRYDSDEHSDQDQDFTACSADDCGYCGKCTY